MSASQLAISEKEQLQAIVINVLKTHPTFNLRQAAETVGVSRSAISNWRKADKDFDQALSEALAEAAENVADKAEDRLQFEGVERGDVQALKFILAAHKADRYRPESKQLTNNGTVINIGQLTVCPREGADLESPAKLIESPQTEE